MTRRLRPIIPLKIMYVHITIKDGDRENVHYSNVIKPYRVSLHFSVHKEYACNTTGLRSPKEGLFYVRIRIERFEMCKS